MVSPQQPVWQVSPNMLQGDAGHGGEALGVSGERHYSKEVKVQFINFKYFCLMGI